MTVDAQFWDNLAARYASKPVEDIPAYQRKLEITKRHLKPEDVVLDIGCGTGSLALELAPHVARVHSVDVSAEMLKIAQEKLDAAQVHNVSLHQSTVQALPDFEAESMDCICAFNIMHLVHERAPLLEQIMKLLKPGGFFVSSTLILRESMVPYRLILPVMKWIGKAPLVEVLSLDQLLSEFRGAGFDDAASKDVGAKPIVAFVVARKPN